MINSPHELEPWLIVLGQPPDTSIALWHIESKHADSIAMFADQESATQYAKDNCPTPHKLIQLDRTALIRLLASSFQQGFQYATLNPTGESARQVFVLRDVLKSAKAILTQARDDSLL